MNLVAIFKRWIHVAGVLLSVVMLDAAGHVAAEVTSGLLKNGDGIIEFRGKITPQLARDLKAHLAKYPGGLVWMESDGGSVVAGIEIGTAIHKSDFATVIPHGTRCASACALAWLGGKKRLFGEGARVGFHAAYRVTDGEAQESGAGNALVGAYLNRIGLSDRAIVYITSAPPSSMNWLSISDALNVGIEAIHFTRPAAKDPLRFPKTGDDRKANNGERLQSKASEESLRAEARNAAGHWASYNFYVEKGRPGQAMESARILGMLYIDAELTYGPDDAQVIFYLATGRRDMKQLLTRLGTLR